METYKHLTLEGARDNFRTKPNRKSAHWYLQALIRHAAAGDISADMLQEGMAEIKEWMNKERIKL